MLTVASATAIVYDLSKYKTNIKQFHNSSVRHTSMSILHTFWNWRLRLVLGDVLVVFGGFKSNLFYRLVVSVHLMNDFIRTLNSIEGKWYFYARKAIHISNDSYVCDVSATKRMSENSTIKPSQSKEVDWSTNRATIQYKLKSSTRKKIRNREIRISDIIKG